jgi:CheY-like chemotaxis protein
MISERSAARRILVVEDAFLTAESLVAMLGELGYAVAGPAPSPSAARRVIEDDRVDAALLDVNLRGELVTPVVDRLVALGIPFLFLTTLAGLDILPEAYRAFPRLAKPCTPDALQKALNALF